MPDIQYLSTPRTGRLVLEGDPTQKAQHLWLVFHGYRQLATSFVRRFAGLIEPGVVVAAPEGLSRFYVDGVRGKVGASWMTKEDRLTEIEDQRAWLDRVWAQLAHLPGQPKVHVLGFSQGVATVWRWMMSHPLQPDSLTLWAGSIPEETDPKLEQRLQHLRFTLAYASEDEFIPLDRAEAYAATLQTRYPHLELLPFEGPHDILPGPLQTLRDRLYGSTPSA
jgi:predicted esterase